MEQALINSASKRYDQAPTIVTQGSRLTGELVINGKLHIDGEVLGSLYVSSEVSVGQAGVLECDFVRSGTLVISGRVYSTVYAELVEIMPGGMFEGTLHCKKLAVHVGGIVVGQCKYKPFAGEEKFLQSQQHTMKATSNTKE